MTHEHKNLAKAMFADGVRWFCYIAMFSFLGRVVPLMPWWAIFALWAVGAIVAHVFLYRGLAGPKPRLYDFRLYYQDSGIAIVILFWFMFFGFFIGPELAASKAERLVGIYWRDGKRHFE